jgi:AraC-like DNA-binding protein
MDGMEDYIGPVATVLDPRERGDVERAGAGLYRTIHRDTVQEVLRDLRQRRVSAVLLSALRCTSAELPRASRVVREFPRIPAVVLVSRHGEASATDLMAIGGCGMQRVIDVRASAGWSTLRAVLSAENLRERDRQALQELMDDLADAPEDMVRFARALFDGYTGVRTVRELALTLDVTPSTLVSRFFRARLPAPKRYLVYAGLVRAARLFENPGFSVADVANHLAHSSPQSFGRHVRTYLGISAGEFRQSYDGTRMMRRFRDELVRPYQSRLRRLSPLVAKPRPIRAAIGALAHAMAQRA